MNDKLLKSLETQGCRFADLFYVAKGTGEVARHTLLLGVSLENAYRKDLAKLEAMLPSLEGVEREACEELIASLQESLAKGIGNNSQYTQKGMWKTICPGIRKEEETGKVQIYGFSIRKRVIQEGEYKVVKSRPKTIAKNKLRKQLRSGKFRPFSFEPGTEFELHANKLVTKA